MLKRFLCFLFVFFGVFSFAQDNKIKPGNPNDLDKLYVPEKNSTVSSATEIAKNWGVSEKKNFVKFNFGILTRNILAVHYLRKITQELSIQAGIGYSYGKDPVQKVGMSDMRFYFSDKKSALGIDRILGEGMMTKGNSLFLTGSLRYIYEPLSFIALEARYSSLYYNVTKLDNYPYDLVSEGDHLLIKNYCYLVQYGFQFEIGSKLVTSHEFYFGAGIRRTKYDIFTESQVTSFYMGSSTTSTLYTKTSSRETAMCPMFSIGYVLGFGF